MEGKARIAVIAVGESPLGLSQELEKRGIAVSTGDIASVEELVEQNRPHLIALVGIRGAMEVSTLLEDQDRNTSPRVAVIAARRDLSRLWGLNRDVVISLLATEMGDKVVAGRLDALARQAAKKRGENIEGPPPMSLGPRPGADAFTTVAPQAVAAIQLVKQAQTALNGGLAAAGTLEPNELGPVRPIEPFIDELDSASLESERPPQPAAVAEAPLPSPSLLVTRAGMGLPAPAAPRREPSRASVVNEAEKPDPGMLSLESETTVTFDSRSVEEKAAELAAPAKPTEDSAGAPVSVEAVSDGRVPTEGANDESRDSGPVIDTDSLMKSLRFEEEATTGGTAALAAAAEAAPGPEIEMSLASDPDLEPDSGELTRPGKTVLGMGLREPEKVANAISAALATSPGLSPVEANFFEDDKTPPSGTAASPAPIPAPQAKKAAPAPRDQAWSEPKPQASKALPATLLALLAAAAGGGFYINSQAQKAENLQVGAPTVRAEAPTPAKPDAPLDAPASTQPSAEANAPSPAPPEAPPANVESAPAAPTDSSAATAPAPTAEKPGEPTAPSEQTPPPATPPAPEGAPAEAQTTASLSPPAVPTPTANASATDEVLVNLLAEPEVAAKTCSELVPNPKQGVRDPAAEGSVPWQAARKAIVRGDVGAAQTSMCEAAFINPASPALESLALLYITQNAPTEALKWLDKADQVRPNVRDTQDLRGTALTQLGRISEARAVWLKSLSLSETDAGRLKGAADEDVATAKQHLAKGDIARAERRLRRAVVLLPTHSSALATLAEVMLRKGRLDAAQGLATQAIQAEPFFPDAYVVLADIAKQQNDLARARQNLERALQIRPDFWAAKKALKELNKLKP